MTTRNRTKILGAALAALALLVLFAVRGREKAKEPPLELSLPVSGTSGDAADQEAVRKLLGASSRERKNGVFSGPEADKLYKTPGSVERVAVSTAPQKLDYAASLLTFAEQGNIPAQNLLAEAYLTGNGAKKDYAEAFKWFKKSADEGNAAAQFKLGGLYYSGTGVTRDLAASLDCLRRSASGGYPPAQAALGAKYLAGEDMQKDAALGLDWVKKAAEGGHNPSQVHLAGMYYYGRDTAIDLREARKWFLLAAEGGNQRAQFNAGLMLSKGEGGGQDLAAGYKWLLLAAKSPDEKLSGDAKKATSALEQLLSPEEKGGQ